MQKLLLALVLILFTAFEGFSQYYVDYGISNGMQYGIDAAVKAGVPVEYRHINTCNEIGPVGRPYLCE